MSAVDIGDGDHEICPGFLSEFFGEVFAAGGEGLSRPRKAQNIRTLTPC